MFSEASAYCGGGKGPLTCWTLLYTSPCMEYLPFSLHPHSFISFPVHQYVWGYLYVIWGFFPYVGGLGVFPHLLSCPYALLYIFVVCYVSCFYGYDYYSSSYGGFFWPVIGFISGHCYFPDGVSCNLGSVWEWFNHHP